MSELRLNYKPPWSAAGGAYAPVAVALWCHQNWLCWFAGVGKTFQEHCWAETRVPAPQGPPAVAPHRGFAVSEGCDHVL